MLLLNFSSSSSSSSRHGSSWDIPGVDHPPLLVRLNTHTHTHQTRVLSIASVIALASVIVIVIVVVVVGKDFDEKVPIAPLSFVNE